MKRAFITGCGQDASYLAEYLLDINYEVHILIRRQSSPENQHSRLDHVKNDNLHFHYGDMTDMSSLMRIMVEVMPDEIYNLAAQSHVRVSFDLPHFTVNTNAMGVLNILEAYRQICPKAKFYQASSSEMFGNTVDEDGKQRESTPMTPVSPYGCSKLFGYSMIRHYRKAYGLHACNGILFNHSSPRRAMNFVIPKVIRGAVAIKLGKTDKLELGNLDSSRDFGHAYDYVRGMYRIINHDVADDFVISTMDTHTIRDLCKLVFSELDMNYEDYIVQNPKYMRPEELNYLCGDSTKFRNTFPDFEFKYSYDAMIKEMVDDAMNKLK